MKLKQFEKSDWYKITNPVVEFPKELENDFIEYTKSGVNFSIVDGDSVLAVGGIVYLKEEIAEAWIRTSKEIKNKIRFLKIVKDGFKILADTFDKKVAIQSVISCKLPQGIKLAKYLGFYKTVDTIELQNESYDRYVKAIS